MVRSPTIEGTTAGSDCWNLDNDGSKATDQAFILGKVDPHRLKSMLPRSDSNATVSELRRLSRVSRTH